jgi:hypothetical protein
MVFLSLVRAGIEQFICSESSGSPVEPVLRQLFFECSNIYAKQLGSRVPVAVGTQQRTLDIACFSRRDDV